ncbi:GNAT family N-acetyltransferase [Actinoplanes philippinensis]|uniref:GNAT family N-acetyltransferase n=1 Tax=Actinoplanes philippinensis TaxID=35752 RepID=UPI0033C6D5B1
MQSAEITRVSERHWHALDDDQVVGRGEVWRRPDGRSFLSIDAWHGTVFDRLAGAMLPTLPKPLYTVVDEDDLDLLSQWERLGFGPRRREWELVVPTGDFASAAEVTIGPAEAGPLWDLDSSLRAEIDATVGWHNMPAEVFGAHDPSRYTVATVGDRYVGLVRVAPIPRRPRIGLIAVLSAHRRRGIGRALLAAVLGAAHRSGAPSAGAEVNQANTAALALFESFGARRESSNLELVLR